MKAFVKVLKNDFLIGEVVDEIGHLRNEFAYIESGNIVVGQRDSDDVLAQTDLYVSHLGCSLFSCRPFARQLQSLLSINIAVFLSSPQTKLSCIATKDKTLGEGANGSD